MSRSKSNFMGGWKMCLAIPARVVQMLEGDRAVVEMGGVQKDVSLALLDDVSVGDYVIVHVGFALNILDPAGAESTLALFADLETAAS